MKNENEKLNKFKIAVFSEVEQQAQDIIMQAQQQQRQQLKEAKDVTTNELLANLETIEKQNRAKTVREVSSRKLEAQRKVLSHRNEMIDKVFDSIRKNLAEFCKSEDYKELLRVRLAKCEEQTGTAKCTAYFSRRDIGIGQELCKGTKFTPQESQSITLGGVTVICEASGIAYDCTFDSSLNQQRELFSKASGLSQI